jgi:hypothetical protein
MVKGITTVKSAGLYLRILQPVSSGCPHQKRVMLEMAALQCAMKYYYRHQMHITDSGVEK